MKPIAAKANSCFSQDLVLGCHRSETHCHLRLIQNLKLNAIGRLIFLTGILGLVHIY